jgi:hypothetical protein
MESSNMAFLRVPLACTNIYFGDSLRQLDFFTRARLWWFSTRENSFRQLLSHTLKFLPMVGCTAESQILQSHGFSARSSVPLIPPDLALAKFFAAENSHSERRRKTPGFE